MNKTIIYLIGFSGSGKLTIAKELCNSIDAVIASNNIFNNIILNIVDFQNAKVPDDLWEKIFVVRKNLLEILGKHYIKSKHYIFTSELVKGDQNDQRIYYSVVDLSKKMEMTIFPVVLHCSKEELVKRVQSEDRCKYNKITNPCFVTKKTEEKKLFIPKDALEINNSFLTPEEVVEIIAERMEKRKESEKLIVTSITKKNKEHKK